MSRPRSEEKRTALLDSAATVVAADGVEARTATIAKLAGVAEGTLFRHFSTKDVLLDELYLYLKRDLGHATRAGFAAHGSLEEKARSLWEGYINWGIANPSSAKALSKLAVAECISAEARSRAANAFPEVADVSRACAAMGTLAGLPAGFADAIFGAVADATIQFAMQDPARAEAFKQNGFKVFWNGLGG